jgi:hypothetical protein
VKSFDLWPNGQPIKPASAKWMLQEAGASVADAEKALRAIFEEGREVVAVELRPHDERRLLADLAAYGIGCSPLSRSD